MNRKTRQTMNLYWEILSELENSLEIGSDLSGRTSLPAAAAFLTLAAELKSNDPKQKHPKLKLRKTRLKSPK